MQLYCIVALRFDTLVLGQEIKAPSYLPLVELPLSDSLSLKCIPSLAKGLSF